MTGLVASEIELEKEPKISPQKAAKSPSKSPLKQSPWKSPWKSAKKATPEPANLKEDSLVSEISEWQQSPIGKRSLRKVTPVKEISPKKELIEEDIKVDPSEESKDIGNIGQ